MKKQNISNKLLLTLVIINLLMLPIAYSVSDEETISKVYISEDEIIKNSLFAQVKPITNSELKQKSEKIDLYQLNPADALVETITTVIKIITVAGEIIGGIIEAFTPPQFDHSFNPSAPNLTHPNIALNGDSFDASFILSCSGPGCDDRAPWTQPNYFAQIEVTLPNQWEITYSNFPGEVSHSYTPGNPSKYTIRKNYYNSFDDISPIFTITPHVNNHDPPTDYTLEFVATSDFPEFPTARITATITIMSNDPDYNPDLCADDNWHWIQNVGCCGDVDADCGSLSALNDDFFCFWNNGDRNWYDMTASDNVGEIGEVGCADPSYSVVSDGTDTYMCDGPMNLGIDTETATCLLSLYSPTNSHVGQCGEYDYDIYCQPPEGYTLECSYRTGSCQDDETEILKLFAGDNAHAAVSDDYEGIDLGGGGLTPATDEGEAEAEYNKRICCKAQAMDYFGNPIDVNILKPDGNELAYILSLSGETNAHASYDQCMREDAYEDYIIALRSDDEKINQFWCGLVANNPEESGGLVPLSSFEGHLEIRDHEYLCQCELGSNAELRECCTEEDEQDCVSNYYYTLGTGWGVGAITYYCIRNNTWLGSVEVAGHDYCEVINISTESNPDYLFRSFRGLWESSEDYRAYASSIAWENNSVQQQECCRQDQCWIGDEPCYDQQNYDPTDPPFPNRPRLDPDRSQENIVEGLRCIDGEWTWQKTKLTWDKRGKGYCPYESQCLVNPQGSPDVAHGNLSALSSLNYDNWNSNDIQCINDKQFIGDHYCDNGTWTSRTKLVALKLLDIAGNDYTLFCDDYTNSLNYYEYGQVQNYFAYDNPQEPASSSRIINNICVLRKYPSDKVVIGIALNRPINETISVSPQPAYSFLYLLDIMPEYCDDAILPGGYNPCDTPIIMYNHDTMSMLYSKGGVPGAGFFDVQTWINWWETLINYLLGRGDVDYPDLFLTESYSFTNNTQDFNRIYIDKKGNKQVHGIMERVAEEPGKSNSKFITYMAIEYTGFNNNICTSVLNYTEEKILKEFDFEMPITCNISSGKTYVQTWTYPSNIWTNDGLSTEQKTAWKELTAKLRVKE